MPLKPLQGVKKPAFAPPKNDDTCVGFEKDTNKLVTLKDLFETAKVKSESCGVLFTPLITKQLKKKFDSAYATYKESRGDIAEVEPQYVKELYS